MKKTRALRAYGRPYGRAYGRNPRHVGTLRTLRLWRGSHMRENAHAFQWWRKLPYTCVRATSRKARKVFYKSNTYAL